MVDAKNVKTTPDRINWKLASQSSGRMKYTCTRNAGAALTKRLRVEGARDEILPQDTEQEHKVLPYYDRMVHMCGNY